MVLRVTLDPEPRFGHPATLRPLGRCLVRRGSLISSKPFQRPRKAEASNGSHEQQHAGAGGPVGRGAVRRHGVALAASGTAWLAARQWSCRAAARDAALALR